jgi:hypothetical protein
VVGWTEHVGNLPVLDGVPWLFACIVQQRMYDRSGCTVFPFALKVSVKQSDVFQGWSFRRLGRYIIETVLAAHPTLRAHKIEIGTEPLAIDRKGCYAFDIVHAQHGFEFTRAD